MRTQLTARLTPLNNAAHAVITPKIPHTAPPPTTSSPSPGSPDLSVQTLRVPAAQGEVDTLRGVLELASSAGATATAEWQNRAEAAEREVATVRERARALMEERDSQISSLRVLYFPPCSTAPKYEFVNE